MYNTHRLNITYSLYNMRHVIIYDIQLLQVHIPTNRFTHLLSMN